MHHLSVSISKEPGVHEEFGFGAEAGLSAEVAALVHAAKAKEWTPEAAGIDGDRWEGREGTPVGC